MGRGAARSTRSFPTPVERQRAIRRAHRPAHGDCCALKGAYDVVANKRRVTLNLDADVVAALEAAGGRSLSDTANRALRGAVAAIAHRRALLQWLDELDAEHGAPSFDDVELADRLLDDVFGAADTAA